MPQSTKTAIMVIGGAEDKVHGREILHSFFGRSGATDARIAIIPSASREPAIIGDRYRTIFEEMGAKGIEILDIRDREQCDDPLMRSMQLEMAIAALEDQFREETEPPPGFEQIVPCTVKEEPKGISTDPQNVFQGIRQCLYKNWCVAHFRCWYRGTCRGSCRRSV